MRGCCELCVRLKRESGELTGKSRVKDEEETGGERREARPDKNSPTEPEILIIQDGEPLILDQCRRLLDPLLTVTNRACMFYYCIAVISQPAYRWSFLLTALNKFIGRNTKSISGVFLSLDMLVSVSFCVYTGSRFIKLESCDNGCIKSHMSLSLLIFPVSHSTQ